MIWDKMSCINGCMVKSHLVISLVPYWKHKSDNKLLSSDQQQVTVNVKEFEVLKIMTSWLFRGWKRLNCHRQWPEILLSQIHQKSVMLQCFHENSIVRSSQFKIQKYYSSVYIYSTPCQIFLDYFFKSCFDRNWSVKVKFLG